MDWPELSLAGLMLCDLFYNLMGHLCIDKFMYLKTAGTEASSCAYVDLTVVVTARASMAIEQPRLISSVSLSTFTRGFAFWEAKLAPPTNGAFQGLSELSNAPMVLWY